MENIKTIAANMRHAARNHETVTMGGGLIFGSDNRDAFENQICEHINADKKPAIGYAYDSRQGFAFPYTVWRRTDAADIAGIVGTPCRTFDEVCKTWGK